MAFLEVQVSPVAQLCMGKGNLVVGLQNSSNRAISVGTDGGDAGSDEWPGKYSYWCETSEGEERGGVSGEVVCACSDGPCPVPCGGPERDLSIAPGARRDWRIPVVFDVASGTHRLSLELGWYERLGEGNAKVRRYQGDFQLIVGDAKGECATVLIVGPPNPRPEADRMSLETSTWR